MSKTYKLIQGEKILSAVHNDIQTNGVFFSRAETSINNNQSLFKLIELESELGVFNGMKIKMYSDSNSETNTSYVLIDNVTYNLEGDVIGNSINNLIFLKAREGYQETDRFVVEKSGGSCGASWQIVADLPFPNGLYVQNTPVDTGIILPVIDFNMVAVICYYDAFDGVSQETKTFTQGGLTIKDVAIRPDITISQGYFPAGFYYIPTYPTAKYTDADLNFFFTNGNHLYLGTTYVFNNPINRIVVKIM